VKLLDAPPGHVLDDLFMCRFCDNDVVVFDGTATGTLNPLYLLEVPEAEVDASPSPVVSKSC
jgi:hypothetical protein